MMTDFEYVAEAVSELQRTYQQDDFFYTLEAQGKAPLLSVGEAELVDAQTGEEDGPSDIWMVFRIIGKPDLYRVRGHYNSWDGSDWTTDPVERVTAHKRVVTVYEVEETGHHSY